MPPLPRRTKPLLLAAAVAALAAIAVSTGDSRAVAAAFQRTLPATTSASVRINGRRRGDDDDEARCFLAAASSAADDAGVVTSSQPSSPSSHRRRRHPEVSYYKRADGPWRPRRELDRLSVGERLFASRLPASDLLDGKSGPKVFFECGVGRRNGGGKWSIVNGMLRVGRRGMKASVVRKKMKKFPPDSLVEVYVSRIRLDEGRLEVSLDRDEAIRIGSSRDGNGKVPASNLKGGEELDGVVRAVRPYGVLVDVGATRRGLVHITKVARRHDAYIAREDGLRGYGLGRGSRVRVVVVSNDRKRLELDLAAPPPPAVDADDAAVVDDGSVDGDGKSSGSDSTARLGRGSPVKVFVVSNDRKRSELDLAAPPPAVDADDVAVDGGSVDEDGKSSGPDSTASYDISEDEAAAWAAYDADEGDVSMSVSEDEAAMWAAYAADPADDDVDADRDEDRDIEDALGIGSW